MTTRPERLSVTNTQINRVMGLVASVAITAWAYVVWDTVSSTRTAVEKAIQNVVDMRADVFQLSSDQGRINMLIDRNVTGVATALDVAAQHGDEFRQVNERILRLEAKH